MKKFCLIYNTAPHYREAIFKAIDNEYDCDWYFGETKSDIKEMDLSLLKSYSYYRYYGNPSKLYWKSVLSNLFKKKYGTYMILAESRALSDYVFIGLKTLLFPKKKIYIWTHGWYGKESKLEEKMKLWLFRHVDGIFIYGNYARQLLINKGIPAKKLFTIHNSLHYERQKALRKRMLASSIYVNHFGNNDFVIIFIGRLTKVKQLDMLINAIATLETQGEHYNLVFVGDGVERERLKVQVETLKLQERVWFYGACYDEKINAELIYNADLCVAPGNIGLTAMHTMAFGCPVITHNCFEWQMPEFEAIRQGETGDFFEYKNEQSLVDTISKWFKVKANKRDVVRKACYNEIDTQWNPYFQMGIIKKNIIIS